jgi:hypothetical protein
LSYRNIQADKTRLNNEVSFSPRITGEAMLAQIPASVISPTPARRSRLAAGLFLLHEASADAVEMNVDKWEFALTTQELVLAGLSRMDLRWLVSHKLLDHAIEKSGPGKGQRVFRSVAARSITEQSCFVLTESGRKFAETLAEQGLSSSHPNNSHQMGSSLPSWDAGARELSLRGSVVKRFRTPAPSQELILAAFEKARWVSRIENPLTEESERDTQDRRLHDTIRRLNGNQQDQRP